MKSRKKDLLTAERLREIMDYDPETGVFTWRKGVKFHKAGTRVGWMEFWGYWVVGIDRHQYRLCRLAWLYMTGKWPKDEIDHINTVRSDDCFANLREATRSMNAQNLRKPHKDNEHGLAGIMRYKKNWSTKIRWTAQIMVNGERHHLGVFGTPEDAHLAYLEAKRELHEGCTI